MKRNPIIAAVAVASFVFAGSAVACEDKESSAAVKEPAFLSPATVGATKKPSIAASEKRRSDAPLAVATARKPAVAKKQIVVAGGQP